MGTRQLYLAAYDISDDRRRTDALKLMRRYATGGQKSVHEVWLTPAEKRRLLEQIVFMIDEDTDRFSLLRLDPKSQVLLLGRARPPVDPDYFYIG